MKDALLPAFEAYDRRLDALHTRLAGLEERMYELEQTPDVEPGEAEDLPWKVPADRLDRIESKLDALLEGLT